MKKINSLLFIFFLLIHTACKDSFFDINDDPNGPTRTTPNFMLPNIIQQSMDMVGTGALATVTITEQLSTQRANRPNVDNWVDLGSVNYSFQNAYWLVGSNNESMMKWAAEEGSWHHVGAGKVLKAITYGVTLDLFGDIYYDQAINASIAQPKFDEGEYVYGKLLNLCDEAIAEFNKTTVFRPLSQGDILYNGDIAKWKKLTYGIKARLLNHLSKKSTYNPAEILSLVDQSFTSTAEEAGFEYPGGYPRSNPWGPDGELPSSSKTWDKFYVDYLKGIGLGGVEDPRLPFIVNPGSDGVYRGVVNGITKDGLEPDLVGSLWGKYYTSDTSPYPLLTFEEVKFIEAEAAFLSGDKARAFRAYQTAIRANMEKLGVEENAIATHLSSAAIAQNAASLTLTQIMTQKYISLGFNPELWVDMRRYDYNPAIYPNLTQPVGVNPALGGQWIRRLPPFSTENDFNRSEVQRIGGFEPDYIAKPVWWDQP